jgi:(R,R)-butanediol dehydrogenase/meso-butanediol dehydrogenase/diacetyl reductase/L-iditol 2-dehydrogenase
VKAAVLKEVGVLEVQDVPEPETAPDQIKVKIVYSGICGTDPEIVEGRFVPPKPPLGPNIVGHEASGTIVEIGKDIQGTFKIGQKVAMNFRSSCGACYYCTNKMEHFCERMSPASGAMAEYAVYKESAVFPLPDSVPLDVGAMLEPVSVAVHTMDIAQVKVGDAVIITGAGTIGMLLLQLAIRSGASKVLVSEPVAAKRKLAKELGADVVVDPVKENLEEAARKLTDGRGFNVCFEASGRVAVAKQLIYLAESCGTVVWCAVYPRDAEVGVPPFYMYSKELTIRSILVSPYSFPRAMHMLSKLNLKPLITVYPLKDVVKAFADLKAGKGIKIMLQP